MVCLYQYFITQKTDWKEASEMVFKRIKDDALLQDIKIESGPEVNQPLVQNVEMAQTTQGKEINGP